MKLSIEEQFRNGIALRDNGQLKEAIDVFLDLVEEFKNHPDISKIYIVLAGVYRDLHDTGNSLKYFKKATVLNPRSELASLGLYLAYVKLGEDEEAIIEINRYLSHNSAKLYKDTLEELLSDLAQGRLEKYRETILSLAKKNDVHI